MAMVPPRGRDILPMLAVLSLREFSRYQTVVKICDTHRPEDPRGAQLGGERPVEHPDLLSEVLPSAVECAQIAREFALRDDLMLACAAGQLRGPRSWGHSLPRTIALARRLGIRINPASLQFPAGSMYWIRPEILEQLRNLDLAFDEFEAESGEDTPTTVLAIERLVGILAARAGEQLTIPQLLADPEGA